MEKVWPERRGPCNLLSTILSQPTGSLFFSSLSDCAALQKEKCSTAVFSCLRTSCASTFLSLLGTVCVETLSFLLFLFHFLIVTNRKTTGLFKASLAISFSAVHCLPPRGKTLEEFDCVSSADDVPVTSHKETELVIHCFLIQLDFLINK